MAIFLFSFRTFKWQFCFTRAYFSRISVLRSLHWETTSNFNFRHFDSVQYLFSQSLLFLSKNILHRSTKWIHKRGSSSFNVQTSLSNVENSSVVNLKNSYILAFTSMTYSKTYFALWLLPKFTHFYFHSVGNGNKNETSTSEREGM